MRRDLDIANDELTGRPAGAERKAGVKTNAELSNSAKEKIEETLEKADGVAKEVKDEVVKEFD